MIKRALHKELKQLLKEYPVVSILGPRQAGKTTLAKMTLKSYRYVNLELPENRNFAEEDPKAFLEEYSNKVILDEIQRVPTLLSYIQVRVDESGECGQFVLTGSHQLELRSALTQSLAGRVGLLHLLPFSISELASANIHFNDFSEMIFKGFLPRIYDKQQRPATAWANYYQSYVEKDVRQLINLKDAALFEKFMRLLAGRAGQLLNVNSLANDVGVDNKTLGNWLSVLEASYIIFKLPPYFENFGKRVIKSPKYYFSDTGLLAYLLGINEPSQIKRDPLLGSMFENLVALECLKGFYNRGLPQNMYFYRDSNGFEVDLLLDYKNALIPVEVKSSSTFSLKLADNLKKFKTLSPKVNKAWLVYNGEERKLSRDIGFLQPGSIDKIFR